MKSAPALPKQLQFMLKQASIPILKHDNCLHARAASQMTEYLKIVIMRTSPGTDEGKHAYNLSELLGFVHSQHAYYERRGE